jgi:mutator protein MutT
MEIRSSLAAMEPTRVGIGLVARGDCYLIRQRPEMPGSPMPGYWEFPGGRCEPGETPEQATLRECREELGVEVVIQRLRQIILHRYPHGLVELHYYDCGLEDEAAEPAPGSGFQWMRAKELSGLLFPEANGPILEQLVAVGRPADATRVERDNA